MDQIGAYSHTLQSLVCNSENISYSPPFVLDLLIVQLHAGTCRIEALVWYFHNEVIQHHRRRNCRFKRSFSSRDRWQRCKLKEDSLESEKELQNFWKIGENWKLLRCGWNFTPTIPYPSLSRQFCLSFLLEWGVYRREFGDFSYHRGQMHIEETDKHSSLYIETSNMRGGKSANFLKLSKTFEKFPKLVSEKIKLLTMGGHKPPFPLPLRLAHL